MTIKVSEAEKARATQFFEAVFGVEGEAGIPMLSFRYGEAALADLLPGWEWSVTETDGDRCDQRTVRYVDPATGLEVRVEAQRFHDFPAVEGVVYLRNGGTADTPIIADLLPLDASFALAADQWCRVHHARGSECRQDDFEPLLTRLGPDASNPQAPWLGPENPLTIGSMGGRSSCGALPFFNLEREGGGLIVGVGWTGDWTARIWRDGDKVCVQAGMRRTHLKLLPGEEIRSPRMLLLFWDGDRLRGHNLLRRFTLAHHRPKRNGEPARAPISFAVWGENRTERQIGKIKWFAENEIPIDNFWIDAGWHGEVEYKDSSNVFNSAWGAHVGNWYPNATAYPDGLGPIGEAVRAAGMDFTLWFEPERVFTGTYFTREHPEWLMGPLGDDYLFNLGVPEAREALTDLISSVIAEGGITVYRQDFNMDAAPFWEAADAPDRVGMSEIRHIEGLYAFWDALLARHPGLLIDNCSSGGRRIDLETNSRSIPLWRSDYQCFPRFDPIGLQGQTHGLGLWVPLSTGACDNPETYALRSGMGPGIVMVTPENKTGEPEGYLTPWEAYPEDWLRKALREQKEVQPYFEGDFYPLVSYSLAEDGWAAWQFDRPDLGEGMVLAFRRQASAFPEMVAALCGLDTSATYDVRDVDADVTWQSSGADLMESGVAIEIADRPGSRLLIYRRRS
jgi:alpha-galactosidase